MTRKGHIADVVMKHRTKVVGINCLTMKSDSDNFQTSSIYEIMKCIKTKGIEGVVYELLLKEKPFYNSKVIKNLDEFKVICDVIVSKLLSDELFGVKETMYTRDLFNIDY